ncbi:MMPL family protein [Gimesia maris]|uniref:MMPL family transporter n=1 Tax=Gimesia maris TaxID=122 RepID=UPI001189C5D9|nr:MMPL family transporter [Gimesia maris]QDT77580.1 MMPL family protein [Gimesia maris]
MDNLSPDNQERSFLSETLAAMTQFVITHSKFSLAFALIVSIGCVLLTVFRLEFKTDRADLIDPTAAFHKKWINYTESFGSSSDLVCVVEADSPESIKYVLRTLGQRIEKHPELFENPLYQINPGDLPSKGLQYLTPRQLQAGLNRLDEYGPIYRNGRWDLTQVDLLYDRLRYQIQSRSASYRGAETDQSLEPLFQHAAILSSSMSRFLADQNDFRSPWPPIVPVNERMRERSREVIYLLNEKGTMGFLKVFPVHQEDGFDGATKAIEKMRGIIGEVVAENPEAKISLTGIPVLENDEMRKSKADMINASIISCFGVGLLLFIGFRGFRHPVLTLLMLTAGMAWAFGYTTLTIGHLNILSVSFAVILIGLGIDFGIHYLAKYIELRHRGEDLEPALLMTSRTVGTGIVTAAITTALAFYCAGLTPFLGIAELGFIGGGGILLCAVATFIVLPALLSRADKNVEVKQMPTPFQGKWLQKMIIRFPRSVAIVSLAIVAFCASQMIHKTDDGWSSKVVYDYNLLNLQASGLESVEIQKRIFNDAQNSLLFAVSVADSPEEARQLRKKFEALPTVHHVEELASRVPAHSSQETNLLVQSYRAQLTHLPREVPLVSRLNPSTIGRKLEQFYVLLSRYNHPTAQQTARMLDQFLNRFESMTLTQQSRFLDEFQYRTTASLLGQFAALRGASDSTPVRFSDLPRSLTSRFVSAEGKWLIQVYPRNHIWEIEPLEEFVKEVRSVDPDVTGTPLQNYEAAQQIKLSYKTASIYALAVICIVLLIDYLSRSHAAMALVPAAILAVCTWFILFNRGTPISVEAAIGMFLVMSFGVSFVLDRGSVCHALLTMLPPVVGGIVMFGILAMTSIDLNPANLIVLPLILGIGVDDGVHVMHDFRLKNGPYKTSPSTINAIVMTSLTSMIGFGSMMIATHRGLYSVGLVLVIGVACCLFISLVTLPALLTWISNRQESADSVSMDDNDETQRNRKKKRQNQERMEAAA